MEDNALVMRVSDGEIVACAREPHAIAWQAPSQLELDEQHTHVVRLGAADGHPRYAAIRIGQAQLAQARPFRRARQPGYLGLSQLQRATPIEQQLAARALHMSAWLHRSAHCGSCGHPSKFVTSLNKRVCHHPGCGAETYPRIEPAVIVLATHGERCLLGRQAGFPPGFYAPLAGFVEAGETPEQAAVREVHEETGQYLGQCRYVGAQPWPYPGSLMLGFHASVAQEHAIVLSAELEDARWFARSQVRQALAAPGAGPLFLPPTGVIASMLIEYWLAGK